MKRLSLLLSSLIIAVLVINLFLTSCAPELPVSDDTMSTGQLSTEDQQILQEYPDDLDQALADLELVQE